MGTYTLRTEPEIDALVERHLRMAVDEIRRLAPDAQAIYLSGSFGRGEGTVRQTARGWLPVNDYDFVVVGPVDAARRRAAADLGRRLGEACGLDYVDIGWMAPEALLTVTATLEHHDFQHGARLLFGAELRPQMPRIEPHQIPRFEYLRLLGNRAAGLLTTLLPARRTDEAYAAVQTMKAWLAVGDVLVATVGRHHHLCTVRRDAFAHLVSETKVPAWLRPDLSEAISAAYAAKLNGWSGDDRLRDCGLDDALAATFCWLAGIETGATCDDLRQVERTLARHYAGSRSSLFWNIGRVMKHRHLVFLRGNHADLQRHVLFAQVAMYVAHRRGPDVAGPAFAERFRWFPGSGNMPRDGEGAAKLWEEWVHA